MQTIESVQNAIYSWRRDHGGRRGPLPLVLRSRAGALAMDLGDEEASAALDLKLTVVRRWREQYGSPQRAKLAARTAPAFVELEPEMTKEVLRRARGSELVVEVIGGGGCVVRIHGSFDASVLTSIIQSAVKFGAGA